MLNEINMPEELIINNSEEELLDFLRSKEKISRGGILGLKAKGKGLPPAQECI